MCFSENISLGFAITGIISSYYFYVKKHYYAAIGILYFSLMELIQYLQYKVINQCDNKTNILLTYIGYLHICFQPLFVNIWLFSFTKNPNYDFLYLSLVAGILLFLRIFWVTDDTLCDTRNEPICGPRTCTFSGEKHLAWNVRLRAAGQNWLTPSIGLHFFLFVIPALITFQFKPIMAIILISPYAALLTSNIHEQPAIWCYTSIMQLLISFFLLK
jgi:hypothetical protein